MSHLEHSVALSRALRRGTPSELNQSTAFGPFINRHHFAGYMELTIALPLGLLFAGAVEKEKRIIYLFIAGIMGVALVMWENAPALLARLLGR